MPASSPRRRGSLVAFANPRRRAPPVGWRTHFDRTLLDAWEANGSGWEFTAPFPLYKPPPAINELQDPEVYFQNLLSQAMQHNAIFAELKNALDSAAGSGGLQKDLAELQEWKGYTLPASLTLNQLVDFYFGDKIKKDRKATLTVNQLRRQGFRSEQVVNLLTYTLSSLQQGTNPREPVALQRIMLWYVLLAVAHFLLADQASRFLLPLAARDKDAALYQQFLLRQLIPTDDDPPAQFSEGVTGELMRMSSERALNSLAGVQASLAGHVQQFFADLQWLNQYIAGCDGLGVEWQLVQKISDERLDMFPSWYPVQRIPQGWGLPLGVDVGAEVRQLLEENFGQMYRADKADQSVSPTEQSSNIAHFFGYVTNGLDKFEGAPDGNVYKEGEVEGSWAGMPNMYGYRWNDLQHLLETLNATAGQFVSSRVYG